LLGILSMLIGSAFASPLLISELEIRPYHEPLPKGPTADINVNVVYANFGIGDTAEGLTDISYFVVLNITNNSDDYAVISMVTFDAAQKITKGIPSDSPFFGENSTSSSGWDAKGAWVDGKWYNLTWVPNNHFWMNASSLIHGKEMWSEEMWEDLPMGEGYWMEGVQLIDKAVGGTVTNIYMNMNGTWVDVTGRVTWLEDDGSVVSVKPERMNLSGAVSVSGLLFSEIKHFGMVFGGEDDDTMGHLFATTNTPIEFNNLWAPHESRLIALSSNRKILNMFLDSSKIEQLQTEPITFRSSVHSQLNGTVGVYDSNSVDDEIKQVQMELTEDGYLYNTILADNQMFVMDSFGVEVFIEPRN